MRVARVLRTALGITIGGTMLKWFKKRRTESAPFQQSSEQVVELARQFIDLLQTIAPGWQRGFFRFKWEPNHDRCNSSYVRGDRVDLISSIDNSGAFKEIGNTAWKLAGSLDKPQGLLLLIVESSFDYEIKFEFEDLTRWQISKMDGLTGIPAGLS
jgi:hypothetical protein